MFWKTVIILGYFVSTIIATPIGIKNMQIVNDEDEEDEQISLKQKRTEMALSTLNLPSNATSIRADITDGFSCENLSYGYYADIENDCQVFHVCLPVVYPDGKENTFRWSFICPEETVFSQDSFTCMRSADMSFGCEESAKYYELNRNFGMILDTSSEMSNHDMDMTSNQMMREKSEMMQENDDEIHKKIESIIKNDDDDYVPTISTTLKPVTIKLDSNKKRRKNPNRKTQPIRKIPTTTSIPITTVKAIEQEPEVTERIVEKTTIKYQRFTKRPDINKDNKKKVDILNKVLSAQTQKRKRPQISLNSASKKTDMNIKKDEKPVTEKYDALPLPLTTTQLPIPEILIERETIKPIIVKKDEPIDPLIVDNKEKEEFLQPTTVIIKLSDIMPATEKPVSDEIISNMSEEEQLIAENNRIPPTNLPQQFIKVEEEESMTQTDGNKKDNTDNENVEKPQNNRDQQSMIINLISSLVNAENTKVSEEEKFDTNVQNTQNNNNQNNDEHLNIMSELMTTKIPEVQKTAEDPNLNSEQAIVNVEENFKNNDDMGTAENYKVHQSNMYNHMTHIPVRIITDSLPDELIAHQEHADQWKEVQEVDEKNDKLESLNTDDKKLVMEKLEEALIEAIKMSEEGSDLKQIERLSEAEKLTDELILKDEQNTDKKEDITNNLEVIPVHQESEEIKPIYHRLVEEPANLLKPEVLSVSVDEQPIVHNIEGNVKIVPESESEKSIPETVSPNSNDEPKIQEEIILNLENKPVNNIPEIVKEQESVPELPSILPTEVQIPVESLSTNSNTGEEEKLHSTETINSSTAESIVDFTIASDRTNSVRSLKIKMDPRKRRFLFRSDAR